MTTERPNNFLRYGVVPWAIVAALALAASWLVLRNVTLRGENEILRTERRLAEIAFESAKNQLSERTLLAEAMINDLGSRLHRSGNLGRLKVSVLRAPAGGIKDAQAIAIWDPDQQAGLLTCDQLPVIGEDQDYQIWVMDPDESNPVNGGVFHVAKRDRLTLAFKPDQPIVKASAFAISLEKKGGGPKAVGPIVLNGKLPDS